MQNEQSLPIDIHTNKLLDWLISRRHCQREWAAAAKEIRVKINSAIQDMPAVQEITQLLTGIYINYFHCVRIVELLKDTESSTRNIFGGYSSKRMKDWLEIIKLYEKDSVYLAEAAQMLVRNVNYEVPSLRKQMVKCQQTQEECEKKEADYLRNSNELKEQYAAACRNLGIEGMSVKVELTALLSALPQVYHQIAKAATELAEACQFYSAFQEFSMRRKAMEVLPHLSVLRSSGNVTTYEFLTGNAPRAVKEVKMDEIPQDSQEPDEIDFGDGEEISFDISDPAESLKTGADDEEGVASGEKALTILDNPTTRNAIIDELSELETFLDQRSQEMHGEGDVLSSNRFQMAPPVLQLQTEDSVAAMLATVRMVLNSLTNKKMLSLQLIRASPRYVDRVAESLQQKLVAADKILQMQEMVKNKRLQAAEEHTLLEPRIALIVSRTRELQKQIENDVSKRYKNRPVNLMGGINTL